MEAVWQRVLIAVTIPLMCMGTVSCLSAEELESLMPEAYEGYIPSEEGPIFYLSSRNLTDIYDGGYMTYVNQGVLTAISQVYTKGSSFYTVILHGMTSRANASSIVTYFKGVVCGGSASVDDLLLGGGGFWCTNYDMKYLYFSQGEIFVTLEGLGDSVKTAMEKSAQDVVEKAVPELSLPCLALAAALVFGLNILHAN